MSNVHLQRGQAAEQLAAAYLQLRGVKILARNLRCKTGELDMVCLDHSVLAIVEVRQREASQFGGALASVTSCKQRKILRATRFFLRIHAQWRRLAIRFDVIAIDGRPDGMHQTVWIKDAFRAT